MAKREDDPRAWGRTLEEEGLPDLEGPLSEKAATGDPQEGVAPPSDRPASFDYGVTDDEEERGEPISVRVAREQPDEIVAGDDDRGVELLDEGSIEGVGGEDELIGEAEDPGAEGLGAEDAAAHVTHFPPGGGGGRRFFLSGPRPPGEDDDEG